MLGLSGTITGSEAEWQNVSIDLGLANTAMWLAEPSHDDMARRLGGDGFKRAVQREAVREVLRVLERGDNILSGGMRDLYLGDDLAKRLRAIRDELVDYDRLRLLYVDPDADDPTI